MKRNAPNDFEESDRPVKMVRSDHTPTPARAFATMTPTLASATASSPSKGALKRKHEALDASKDFAASKKVRLDTSFDGAGITTTSRKGCRGGARVTCSMRAIVDNISDDASDDATTGNTSSPSVGEDTAEVSASTEGDAAVTTSEEAVKTEDDSGEDNNEATVSPPSADEDATEVPPATEEDAAAAASELAENYLGGSAGEDTAEVPTSTEADAAVTATECATKAEDDSNNSSEPVSSSRKSVSGSIESADSSSSSSSSSSSEPASSSPNPANGSNETLDTITTVSEPEEAPKKTTRMAGKKERHITGLLNHSTQCFANATLQFFDAAMDGHDLDLVLGKDVSTKSFSDPNLTTKDEEDPFDTDAPKEGKKPKSKIGKIKASIRDRIKKLRSGKNLKDISPRKHLRALLSRMRGSKDTTQPKWITPMVCHQIIAFGGAEENAAFEDLDGTTQQDCYEYFGALMAGATSNTTEGPGDATEEDIESAAALKSMFEIRSETATVCNNPSCDHKGTVRAETNNPISTSVWKSKKRLELMDMLDESNTSILEDQKCPKCGEETLANVTELKDVGENLVVHINRVDGSGSDNKLQTLVELPLQPITICGKEFILNAVVKHKGYFVDSGHYTILRRRSSEWMTEDKSLWYLIDDDKIKGMKAIDVRDGGRQGHSAMLLFKAL
jgi:hypothetical protein